VHMNIHVTQIRLCCIFYFPCCTYNDNLSTSPAGGGKCTCVNHGKASGKAKSQKSSPYHKVSLCSRACTWLSLRESWREAPERGAPGAPALSVLPLRSMPPLPHAGEAKRSL